jgi:Type VI secretion system, TssN
MTQFVKPPQVKVNPAQYKKTIFYCLGMLVLFALVGALGLLGNSTNLQWIYFLMQLLLVGVGVLHVWLMYRMASFLHREDTWPGAFFTLLLALFGAAATVALYYYLGKRENLGLATATIGFILPYFVLKAFDYFELIPQKKYKLWYYPLGKDIPDMDLLDLSKILVIQFELAKRQGDTTLTNFKAKAPVSMLFGELFFLFMYDYNERHPDGPVQYLAGGQPQGWLFYRKHAWWKRRVYLDPHNTFKANGVQDNDIIIAERANY